MNNKILLRGSFLGALAVVLGAFGAHALKKILTSEQLISFETGVRYQMYHAIVLILLYLINLKMENQFFKKASIFIFYGVILFSGSIYILTLKNMLEIESLKYVAPLTPIGGLLIVIGWIMMFLGGFTKIKQ